MSFKTQSISLEVLTKTAFVLDAETQAESQELCFKNSRRVSDVVLQAGKPVFGLLYASHFESSFQFRGKQ